MQIILYRNESENRVYPKKLTGLATISGTLRAENVNVLEPSITIHANPGTANYCYIREFNRYYYITSQTVSPTGLYTINCKTDVLQTWMKAAGKSQCTANRATNGYDAFVPDSNRKFYGYAEPQYKLIGSLGDNYSLVMVASGYPRT